MRGSGVRGEKLAAAALYSVALQPLGSQCSLPLPHGETLLGRSPLTGYTGSRAKWRKSFARRHWL